MRPCGCAPHFRQFWDHHGHLTEGRAHFSAALGMPPAVTVTGRARFARAGVLKGASNLAWYQGDYEVARSLLEEGLAIGRDLGHGLLIATSLRRLGDVARLEGDHPSAQSLY